MDRRDKVLALFVDALGLVEGDLRTFEGRIKFQKAIYLLQQPPFERDFGFQHNLYIKGPYSPALAAAGYRLLDQREAWQAASTQLQLVDDCAQDIERLRHAFRQQPNGLDGDLLELAATIHFLVKDTFRHLPAGQARIDAARMWIEASKHDLVGRFDEAAGRLRDLEMLD